MHPDVIVIGGGVVGVAAAAHIAASGRSTRLLERATLGAGASGRNSGVVQHPFDPVLEALYRESVARYRALADLVPDEGFDLPAAPAGMLMASLEPEAARRLAEGLAVSHPSLGPTYLGPGEVTALEPSIAPTIAACRLGIGFPVGPMSATRAYAAWARIAGAELREGVTARPWVERSRVLGVEVEGADGRVVERVPAGSVIVAAGPWSPALIDPSGRWRPIEPQWGVVVATTLATPPRHVIEEAWIDIEPEQTSDEDGAGAHVAEGEDGDHAFSLVTAEGRSSVGSMFLAAEPDGPAMVPALLERAARFVPSIAEAAIGPSRTCARPLSRDGRPLIGPVEGVDGLWLAAGHGPWGVSTGPAAATILVDLLDGRRPVPAELDPARFGPIPARG